MLFPSFSSGIPVAALFLWACGRPEPARHDADRPAGDPAATHATATRSSPAGDSAATSRADHARVQGSADAPVYVVEVSDFQCPFCKVWHDSTYPVVKRDYIDTGRARLAYVNFPLSIHPHAQQTAEAAMCAGVQNRFWEMHDALFRTQADWGHQADAGAILDSLAGLAGMDRDKWRKCMTARTMQASVEADYARAQQAGVNSTPSFFINGRIVSGAVPPAEFRSLLDDAVKAASGGSTKK
jgi:protein-disulfide isomerase